MKKFDNLPYHIYWFSGCSNSLLIAIEIQKRLSEHNCEAKLFPMEKTNPKDIDKSAFIGFVVPVAGQGTYPLVWDFIKALPDTQDTYCFLVDTLGLYSGGILGPVKNIVKKKGYVPLGAKEILMPNVFQKIQSNPDREQKMIDSGKEKARRFCDDLVNGQGSWVDIPGYSWLMSLFYRSTRAVSFYRRLFPYSINPDKCKRCGLCVKLCPVDHLSMEDNTSIPKCGSTCMLCHRCFSYCPHNAINIGSKKAVAFHALSLKEFLSYLNNEHSK